MQTKRYSVLTVAPSSPLPLRTKSSSNPRAIPMSPSAVPRVDRQGRQSGTRVVVAATGSHARCFLPHAPSAAKTPKCLSSLPLAGRSIAAIVTEKSDRADNGGLTPDIHRPGISGSCMTPKCDGVSSQRGRRQVRLNPGIACYVAFPG